MRPLPGLPQHYNRAAIILGKALPKPILSDDPLMHLLWTLDTVDDDFLAEARAPLHGFVRSTENLMNSDYGPLTNFAGTSLKELWLPLLFLGQKWAGYVESLLRIPATSWEYLTNVQCIVFTPVTVREQVRLTLRLYDKITGLRKEVYKDFENHIKVPFELKATYNRYEECVNFLDDTSRILNASSEDAKKFLTGDYPPWLDYLLKWDAVERIDIAYHKECGRQIRNQVATILAIPSPISSSASKREVAKKLLDDCFTWLGLPGRQSLTPAALFVLQTSTGEEWYQLLDVYCERLSKFYLDECGLSRGSEREDDERNLSLLYSILERRLALPSDSDLRVDNDFKVLSKMFEFKDGFAKGRLRYQFALSDSLTFSEHLEQRIGKIPYLIGVIEALTEKCKALLAGFLESDLASRGNPLEAQGQNQNMPKEVRAASPTSADLSRQASDQSHISARSFWNVQDKLLDLLGASAQKESYGNVKSSRSNAMSTFPGSWTANQDPGKNPEVLTLLTGTLFRVHLKAYLTNLDIALETIQIFNKRSGYFLKEQDFHNISIIEKDDDLFRSVRQLLYFVINAGSIGQRSKALAALLYVLDPDDVIPGDGPAGIMDDEYCTALTLLSLAEDGVNVSEDILGWAFDCNASIDTRLHSEKQRQVRKLLQSYIDYFRLISEEPKETVSGVVEL